MNKKLLISSVLLVSLTSLAYAYSRETATFKRTFTLDHVDIGIVCDEPLEDVVENNPYEYEISIENKGQPCFVRVSIDEGIYQVNSSWVKVGDYYYYPESVDAGETIQFSDEITFNELEEDSKVDVHVVSEAVQSEHFDLDLSLEDPFEGVEIQSFETGGNV